MAAASGWDADRSWQLHPSVGMRPEAFGALVYHYGSRRLTFLKDLLLTDVVRSLGEHPDGGSALDAAGVPQERRPAIQAALDRLVHAEVIRVRD